jgi:hypothetical protein
MKRRRLDTVEGLDDFADECDRRYDDAVQRELDGSDFDAVTATQRDRQAEETPASEWK